MVRYGGNIETRRELVAVVGPNLSVSASISALLAGEGRQRAVTLLCEEVMRPKEETERGREQDLERGKRKCRSHRPAHHGGYEA